MARRDGVSTSSLHGLTRRGVVQGAAGALTVATLNACTSGAGGGRLPSLAALQAVDFSTLPVLSDRELGLLHYMYLKATAPADDWSLWETSVNFGEPRGVGGLESDGPQYDLTASATAVALATNKTPAYRDFAATVLGGIVDRGLDDRCWRYWTENRSGSGNDGNMFPYSPDPMLTADAMYVGNMGQAIAYHALMTNSRRFDEPTPFVYRGKGVELGGVSVLPGATWTHTWGDIVESLAGQIATSERRMVMCQIPTVFIMCNLSIAQTILAYDKLHGTNHSDVLYRPGGFFESVGEEMFVPPRSSGRPIESSVFGKRQVHGQWVSFPEMSISDVFLCYGMYPTKPDWAVETYAMARRKWFKTHADGTGSWPFSEPSQANPASHMLCTAIAATSAGFARDDETYARTLAWIEKEGRPMWDGDMLFYSGISDDPARALREGTIQAQILSTHASAQGSPMANFDIDRRRFTEPTLTHVDYPTVKVRTATFDREASLLAIQLRARSASTVTVTNLRPGTRATIVMDGQHVSTDAVGPLAALDGAAGVSLNVPAGDHSFAVGVQT